jgi:dienelactone hydrolase
MMRAMRRVVLAVVVLALACSARAGAEDTAPVSDLADGRVGKIHFRSVTPSGYFALARRQGGRDTVIFGTLVVPRDTGARVPAVVIAHGSGGVSSDREFWWADRLKALGVAGFVVDSFTPRGIRETATDQSQLPTAANVADALAALRLLATHPRLDPDRIAVMGFSKGGQVALYTALEPYRRAVIDDDRRFAAHVALYPYCNDWQVSEHVTGAPLLLLLGGRDDYTPAPPCRDYAAWFTARGADATAIVYPDAYHGFDSSRRPAFARNVVTGRNCEMRFDLDHFTITLRSTGADITSSAAAHARSCVAMGATIGADSEASRRAPEDIKTFLTRALGLTAR